MNLTIQNSPVSLRELSLDKLRNAITSGYFPPGKRLVERMLCEEMGVSRSIVREVIRHLETEGLIETVKGKGPTVATLTWGVAAQIYEIRLMLEQSATADCIANLEADTAAEIKAALADFKRAFNLGNVNLMISVSSKLYEKIFSVAGHGVAWEVVQRLNGRISRLRAMTMKSKDRSRTSYQRIEKICVAIYRQRDAAAARAAVAEHIREAASIAQTILESGHPSA